MNDNHFKKSIGSVDPLGHNSLKEVLSGELGVFLGELEANGLKHLVSDFHVSFNDSVGHLANRLHDESDEGSLHLLS